MYTHTNIHACMHSLADAFHACVYIHSYKRTCIYRHAEERASRLKEEREGAEREIVVTTELEERHKEAYQDEVKLYMYVCMYTCMHVCMYV